MILHAIVTVLIIVIFYFSKNSALADKISANPNKVTVTDLINGADKIQVVRENVNLTVLPAGYAASKYMDTYKFFLINYDQSPYTLYNAVNVFHQGDLLCIKCHDKWTPVAVVVNVILAEDAFAVVVLDRPVNISGREVGASPTARSINLWHTTLYPDPIKTPVTEIQSVSRWVV